MLSQSPSTRKNKNGASVWARGNSVSTNGAAVNADGRHQPRQHSGQLGRHHEQQRDRPGAQQDHRHARRPEHVGRGARDPTLLGQLALVAVGRGIEVLRAVRSADLVAPVVQVELHELGPAEPDAGPDDVPIDRHLGQRPVGRLPDRPGELPFEEHELEVLRRPDRLALVGVVADAGGPLVEDAEADGEHQDREDVRIRHPTVPPPQPLPCRGEGERRPCSPSPRRR